MARYDHLPIFKAMMELAKTIENAVRYFPRYHKYTLGSELRGFCHTGLALVMEANSSDNRAEVLLRLRLVLERLKIHLMLAKEVQAFNRVQMFYRITEIGKRIMNIEQEMLNVEGKVHV